MVPMYSGLFTAISHPLTLRALYIDGVLTSLCIHTGCQSNDVDRVFRACSSSDFLSNLLGFASWVSSLPSLQSLCWLTTWIRECRVYVYSPPCSSPISAAQPYSRLQTSSLSTRYARPEETPSSTSGSTTNLGWEVLPETIPSTTLHSHRWPIIKHYYFIFLNCPKPASIFSLRYLTLPQHPHEQHHQLHSQLQPRQHYHAQMPRIGVCVTDQTA